MDVIVPETDRLLRLHLQSSGVPSSPTWTLSRSPIGGRGVFATQDLLAGDLVFVDAALVVGPRSVETSQPLCVHCHRSDNKLTACRQGCGLPVCDAQCVENETHSTECALLREWRGENKDGIDWSPELLRSLTPIRCLSLNENQRRLVRCMEGHSGRLHEREVDLLKTHVAVGPNVQDEEFMRFCCCVLDANAFEISIQNPSSTPECQSSQTSLRGLFPLSAMMNHACTPNTRHGYDKDMRMIVRATVPIPQGTEITTSYFALMWGTSARRHHLSKTKHFLCYCERCKDPQEGGTCLSALKCALGYCPGSLLSESPVKAGSKWACDVCGLHVPEKQARLIQSGLGTMLRMVNCDDPLQVAAFLRGHKKHFATSNQVVVHMKSCLVWIYGHRPGYSWTELSEETLDTKEVLCRELLDLLGLLKAGQCRLKGLFLFELHCTLIEKQRRSPRNNKTSPDEALKAIEQAATLFENDLTAPPELWARLAASHLQT